ncbi:hypothetical protein D3C81_2235080 [compost metagenome]
MPFAEHAPALFGDVIAPVGELGTDGDQPSDNLSRLTEASGAATKTVADHIDRLTGKLPLCAFEHRLEIQRAPVCPRGLKAFH